MSEQQAQNLFNKIGEKEDNENENENENQNEDVDVNEDQDVEDLFKKAGEEDDKSQDKQKQEKKKRKLKKIKKDKKSKKQKKDKKKKRRYQEQEEDFDQEDEEEDQRNSMFEDEAESQSQQDYDQDMEAEVGQQEQKDRFNEMMNRPSARDNYMKRIDGKNERQINAHYSRNVNMLRQSQDMYPGEHDPKIYIVNVKPRHEDFIVVQILIKAQHLAGSQEDRLRIVTATSLRKKHPGKIFVEAFSEKDVRDALEGFNVVSMGKNLIQLSREDYAELFNQKAQTKVQFQPSNFVRITKGLYEGDLAQIIKIKSGSVDVSVVPRLNIQQISMRIKEQTSKIPDQKARRQKMGQLLTLFLNHKSNYSKKRNPKQTISQQELRQQFSDNPALKKIRLAGNPPGLIILNYKFDEIKKHQGTFVPVELMPFTPEGNFIGKLNQEKNNLTTATSFKKGERIEIIAGSMAGHWGEIYEIKEGVATIVCKNKELSGEKLLQPVDNIVKRFKVGDRVKIISGADTGKTGTVLQIQQKTVQIWTDNNNAIRVNKKNLQIGKQLKICEQNVHNLKKDDLIKTSKNQIGLVLQTTKDNIKILDTNNIVTIISNMDFDSKLNTRSVIAKNRSGDEISAGCSVVIRQGVNQGKKGKVLHVYRQNLFLFNAQFTRTSGNTVENAENCSLISKNQPIQPRNFSIKANTSNLGSTSQQITINSMITLRTGSYKGYQGIVKSIGRDKIQVRVLSKGVTEWVPRQSVTTKQQTLQIGKTPNRKGGNTHNYVPSPSRY